MPIELADRSSELARGANRDPLGQRRQIRSTPAVEEILDRVGARFDHGAAGSHVGAEEGARHDVEREGAHVGVQIASLVRHERVDVSLRAFDRDRRVALDALAVERGLHEIALLSPVIAVGRQETFAEHGLHDLQARRFHEVGLIGDEDALDEIGVADEVERDAVEAKARDGAELALAPREEAEDVVAQLGEMAV